MPEIPPIIDGNILKADAINFIAEAVYLSEAKSSARKRVRERIRYGLEIGDLRLHRKANGDVFNAADFFDWAKGKWKDLQNFRGLPTKPIDGEIVAILGELEFSGCGVVVPPNPQELKDDFVKLVGKLHQTELALAQSNGELAKLTIELKNRREKEVQTRKKKSDAGKRGKGAPRTRTYFD